LAGAQGRNIGSEFTIVRGSFSPAILGADGGTNITIGGLRNIYSLILTQSIGAATGASGQPVFASYVVEPSSGTVFPVAGPTVEVQFANNIVGVSGTGTTLTVLASGTSISGSIYFYTAIGD
jgi:hypothetical protein